MRETEKTKPDVTKKKQFKLSNIIIRMINPILINVSQIKFLKPNTLQGLLYTKGNIF